jgi:broad specificity phosphatase PhoE
MLMNTFYLTRHGQTTNNKSKTFSGWVDTPLTEQGILDAHAAATKLSGVNFDVIISSDLGRAFVTAYIISRKIGYTDEILRSNRLREVNYGDIGNVSIVKAQAIYPGLDTDTNFVAPNGESLGQMQQRVLKFISELEEQYTDKTILLVAHGGVIDAVKANFLDEDIGHYMTTQGITNSHDYVAKFKVLDGRVVSHEEITIAGSN